MECVSGDRGDHQIGPKMFVILRQAFLAGKYGSTYSRCGEV